MQLVSALQPEPLRVPLSELDRRYAYHMAGKVYHGVPILPVVTK